MPNLVDLAEFFYFFLIFFSSSFTNPKSLFFVKKSNGQKVCLGSLCASNPASVCFKERQEEGKTTNPPLTTSRGKENAKKEKNGKEK